MTRHALALVFALLFAIGCAQSHGSGDPPEGDPPEGVCCPVAEAGCLGPTPEPGGGWAPSLAECTYRVSTFAGYRRVTDEHGCPRLEVDPSIVCGGGPPVPGIDAGPEPVDAGPGPIDCDDAHPISAVACNVGGCVPAYPSGTGDPDPDTATCVPIHPDICTFACFRVAPPCPTGTVPEGDGACFTDRCIPAFVCE